MFRAFRARGVSCRPSKQCKNWRRFLVRFKEIPGFINIIKKLWKKERRRKGNESTEKVAKRSSSGLPTFSRTVVLARRARALLPRADGIGYLSRVYEGSYYSSRKSLYLNSTNIYWGNPLRFFRRSHCQLNKSIRMFL